MKRLFIITLALCGLTIFGTSCKEKRLKDFQQTEDGLYYKFIAQDTAARSANDGDYLFMTLSYRTDNDSIVFNEQEVVEIMRERQYPGDLSDAFRMMHEGDEAVFAFKADSFMLKSGMPELPPFIKDTTMLYFTVRMNKIRSMAEIDSEKTEEIKSYMASHNLTAEPTESGLYFIETQPGKGKELTAGDSVSIRYTFRTINDSIFDSSEKEGGQPLYCIVGQMFSGLNEGLGKMKRGGKATLIMPYKIAFGDRFNPYVPVPAFSTIVADIEVLPNIVRPQPAPAPAPAPVIE
ncbi:MAG: FKBP-type peptidyl-prolyl cis-trans isomerase [Bacteroidales bacterium]|nr:FKBP-type peptidyl-prolyl cis-trans isomerase [Bacteroidales bacterium]